MPTEFKIPELGENVSAGDVVRVLVKAGDTIEKDQTVLELETDKATIEVPSSVSGTVQEVKVKPGDKVKVGQVVLTVGDGAAADAPPQKAEPAKADAAPAKGASAEGGRSKSAAASAADAPKPKPQPSGAAEEGGLSQAATAERTNAEAQARGDEGTAQGQEEQPRQKPRGEVVDINRGARPAAPPPATTEADAPRKPAAPAAPSVRRLARELGVDIAVVQGSGPGGRISTDDLQAHVRAALSAATSRGPAPRSAALPDFTKWGEVERKPMSNIRRKTAEHLASAWNVIPHVTQHDRADITAVEGLRKRYAPQAEKSGGKLTMTAIALKIVAGALQRFPQFNASIDVETNEIVYKKSIHVGVAADTPRGLLVPVVRDVDHKGIFELAKDLAGLSDKSRAGKLGLDEMQGAGFTITNLGGIGGTSFTPIVNWPEVAILGVSRASWEPIWRPASVEDEGTFEPRLMLPLSLSYDHRVIDGADAARFLRWICEALEQPFLLAL
jgi:pyruvate dehydrogenase E2 component (dihydrolipoyllysine-residue acetyltransferase)